VLGKMNLRLNRNTILLTTILFFAASLALAVHHDDYPLQTVTCSICKVKNSSSGTPHKAPLDSILPIVFVPATIAEGMRENRILVPETDQLSHSKNLSFTFINKAPPSFHS